MAVVGALVIVVFSLMNPPASAARRVSALPAPQKSLWKPEPSLLLSRRDLRLSTSQRMSIEKISREWETEKQQLLTAMRGTAPSQGRVDQVQSQLGDYSRLSQQFNAARSLHWSEATQHLTANQLKLVTP